MHPTSRQRRYLCQCRRCNNDPYKKQTRQMIIAHQKHDQPRETAYSLPATSPQSRTEWPPRDRNTPESPSESPTAAPASYSCNGDGDAGREDTEGHGKRPSFSAGDVDEQNDPIMELPSLDYAALSTGSVDDVQGEGLAREPEDSLDLDLDSDSDSGSDFGSTGFSPPRPSSLVSSSDSDDDLDSEGFDIDGSDPLYASLDSIYGDNGRSPSPDADGASMTDLPPAFDEHALVRRVYVQVFLAVAFHGATHNLAQYMLKCGRSQLSSISLAAGYDIPNLDKMAMTLRTVERRLGLDPDAHITYYFICDHCWATHHPSRLGELPSHGNCVVEDCPGTLFERKRFSDGKLHRIPVKVLSTASPKEVIQRLIMRPGKLAELSKWRSRPHDNPGPKPPVDMDDWEGSIDEDFRMYDMCDAWGWNAIRAGLQRRRGGRWGVEDVDLNEVNQRFVALPNGLVLIFNLDWFRAMKRGNYSVGAIYLTVCNNPRSKRFLREETFILSMIPGPDEPSLEQLNSVLDVFVPELLELYNGVNMKVPGGEELIHCFLYANASDLPAARKASGLRGHTAKHFMCPVCKQPLHSLTHPDCFDPNKVTYREEQRFLKYAFRARYADAEEREEIADERGVRWSSLNVLPGWLPVTSTPTEYMHAAFLGEAKHVVQGILTVGGMLTKRGRHDYPMKKLEQWLENVWWPGSAGRVPKGLITGGTGKADQWRNMVSVLPVGLYQAWQADGRIPDKNAPPLKATQKAAIKAKRVAALVKERRQQAAACDAATTTADLEYLAQETMRRNYRDHYDTVLEWCVGIRIWAAQSISVSEARRAQDCHNRACQTWAAMCCHLTPYFHFMTHFVLFILKFGPVYAWWAFVYERFNGWLSKVNHNGHKGGELEATLMRSWTKLHLISDLILMLSDLGDAKTPEDDENIADLRQCLQGDKRPSENRGTLLNALAFMTATDGDELIQFPKHGRARNLRVEGLYSLVFEYLQESWDQDVVLIPDTSFFDLGSPFIAIAVPFYSHVIVAGQRYGSSTAMRGVKYRYAYIDGRQAVDIIHLLYVKHTTNDGQVLHAKLAIVRPFQADDEIAGVMPWSTRATDLGINVWKYGQLGPLKVIDVRQFSGHFALNKVSSPRGRVWVTMSLCHDSQEPDQIDLGEEPDD